MVTTKKNYLEMDIEELLIKLGRKEIEKAKTVEDIVKALAESSEAAGWLHRDIESAEIEDEITLSESLALEKKKDIAKEDLINLARRRIKEVI